MNLGKFKNLVAGYLNRSSSSLVIGTGTYQVDLLSETINMALKYIQDKYDFLWAREMWGFLAINSYDTQFNTLYYKPDLADVIPYDTKKILDVCSYSTVSSSAGTYIPERRYKMIEASSLLKQGQPANVSVQERSNYTTENVIFYTNKNMWMTGISNPQVVYVRAVTYWPEPVSDDDEHYLITNYPALVLHQTLLFLNNYLKEDQRVSISNAAVERLFSDMMMIEDNRLTTSETNALN